MVRYIVIRHIVNNTKDTLPEHDNFQLYDKDVYVTGFTHGQETDETWYSDDVSKAMLFEGLKVAKDFISMSFGKHDNRDEYRTQFCVVPDDDKRCVHKMPIELSELQKKLEELKRQLKELE